MTSLDFVDKLLTVVSPFPNSPESLLPSCVSAPVKKSSKVSKQLKYVSCTYSG
jgi:hypothetical protein